MTLDVLPTRRDEAWKWSDLRAALRDGPAPRLAGEGHIIARLAGAVEAIAVAPGAHRAVVERLNADGLQANACDITVAEGATLTRIVIQTGAGVGLSHAKVRLAAGARFSQFVLAEGGRLARIETQIDVAGEGAEVVLDAIYLAGPGRHADLTSHIAHTAGGAHTVQTVRGAARKGGRGVFQGKIFVARDAQKTDASQHHKALLLEEGAEVYAKPELEIYADDVACAHGNTAGALDEAALFYMRARGVPLAQARALLTEAFLREALPDWLDLPMAQDVEARIAAWLEAPP